MTHPKRCSEVSPQCPDGQDDGYKVGYYHGQVAAYDDFTGTPCEQIRHAQDIERLVEALKPFAFALMFARDRLGEFPDINDTTALAGRWISHDSLKQALSVVRQFDEKGRKS